VTDPWREGSIDESAEGEAGSTAVGSWWYCAKNASTERRLEGLAVEVLTALDERDHAVWDAEMRARQAV
jgi:hypothetical protein